MTIPLEILEQAIARYERGDRIMDLALDFKTSFYAMRNALREAGVQIRTGNATRSIQRKQQQTAEPDQLPQEPRARAMQGYNELMGRMAIRPLVDNTSQKTELRWHRPHADR